MKFDETTGSRPAYWGGASTFLFQHRGTARLTGRRALLRSALGLAIFFTAAWVMILQLIGPAWGYFYVFWLEALGLPGRVVLTYYEWLGGLLFPVPYLDVAAAPPSQTVLFATGAVTVLLYLASYFVPRRMVPGTYFLRAALFVQATAVIFFACWPEAFPYTLAQYLKGLTTASLFVAALAPLVLGFTFYPLDFTLGQKAKLTVVIMGYMTVMVPMQYIAQGAVIHHGSLLFMPLLYLFFGLPLNVLALIALYAWGMSWEGATAHAGTTPVPAILTERAALLELEADVRQCRTHMESIEQALAQDQRAVDAVEEDFVHRTLLLLATFRDYVHQTRQRRIEARIRHLEALYAPSNEEIASPEDQRPARQIKQWRRRIPRSPSE